ncbi:ImpA family metalloprotease [Thalassolituus sp. LLYu03]|uniref:ImpA family metalloprotease n=1 Tax=Thalassolituus sp. LLYu03 TaxID=3421656 RepID=UPI003D274312
MKHTLTPLLALILTACGGSSTSESHSGGSSSAVEKAISTGDASVAGDAELLEAALATIDQQSKAYLSVKARLLQLNSDGSARSDGTSLTAVTWDVTHDAARLGPQFGYTDSLLISNASNSGTSGSSSFAVVGTSGSSRHLVLGSNPMRTWKRFPTSVNDQMQQLLRNSFEWLAGRKDFAKKPLNLVIAQMDESYYFPDRSATRAWLSEQYAEQVTFNDATVCDGTALAACITSNTDVLVISQVGGSEALNPSILAAVKAAQAKGKGILYLHYDGGLTDLGNSLLTHLRVTYSADNYWAKYYMNEQDMSPYFALVPPEIADIRDLLLTLKAGVPFDLSQCSGEDCSMVDGFSAFSTGLNRVRSRMTSLDQNKKAIFNQAGEFRLDKLLALLGDSYRQQVQFPMSRDTADANAFARSMYADSAVYNQRRINPVQADLGNFSRTDFSHITPVTRTIDLQSKRSFRAAGVYVIPGKTVRVTRLDDSATTVAVGVNSLRSASTHWLATGNGYNRPKYLQSQSMALVKDESIEFTSPYGGPLQVFFGSNDQTVTLKIENIGLHPYWNGEEDNEDFAARLAAGDFDWAELSTSGFEVHSQLEKMRNSMNGWGGTAADLAIATKRYVSNLPHVLAGFQGPGIDVVDEIHDFAADNGFTVQTIDMVKHMNADQPTCGWGCSGNPYDAGWSFSPIGHGDIHELGHGLERGRFRFAGWDGHSTTNPYSYHSKYHYYLDTGKDPGCQSLPFESLFDTLQASRNQADPVAYMQAQNLTGWSQGAAIYIEMMMAAQAQGALTDGWMLLPRLHILDREFSAAVGNDTNWDAKKAALGFASFTRSEASALSNNDWLIIALSKVTGRDMREYLRMWGFAASDAVSAQVASMSLTPMSKTFYASGGAEFCKGLDKPSVAIDGTSAWPL